MIPIIDIAKIGLIVEKNEYIKIEDYKQVGSELYKAFSEVGFVYVQNSGIKDSQIAKAQEKFYEFYQLDEEIKSKYNFEKKGCGYFGIGNENLAYGEIDHKEAFNVNGEMLLNPETMTPDAHVSGFSESASKMTYLLGKLSKRLILTLSYGMKLKDINFLPEKHRGINGLDNYTAMRSTFYPPVTDDLLAKLNVRLGAHSDYGTITLLFQDNMGGLQIQAANGDFVDAPYIPETVVVNLGDIMNLWTEGRLKSTVHRVVIPKDKETRLKTRTSMVYFVFPDHSTPIEVMEYEEDADPPRPDRMLLNPKSGPKIALEWGLYKWYKAHNLPLEDLAKHVESLKK